ncbi:MAG: hypothetical protein Q9202_005464 [Teloschistes flavicans]
MNNEISEDPPEPLSPGRTSPAPPATTELAAATEVTTNPISTVNSTSQPRVERSASLNNPRRGLEQPFTSSPSDVLTKKMKFQPKSAIRRSKEEREAIERAETERLQARLAANDASSGFSPGRGGLRGRGDRRGGGISLRWQGERYVASGASGFLGGATPAEDKRQRETLLARSRGGGGGGRTSMPSRVSREATEHEGTTGVKKESSARSGKAKDQDGDTVMRDGGKRRSTRVKKEKGEPVLRGESDDELFELEPSGKRINIENINLISDEESSDENFATSRTDGGKERSRTPRLLGNSFMRPIRIDRHEHVERTIGVNTDASSLTSAELRRQAKARGEAQGSLFLPDSSDPTNGDARKPKGRKKGRDVEFLKNERRWQGVYLDEEDDDWPVGIKEEPKEQNDPMIIDDGDNEMAIQGTAITQSMLDEHHTSTPKSNAIADHPQTPRESSIPEDRLRRKKERQGPRFFTCRRAIPPTSVDDDKEVDGRHHDLPIPSKELQSATLQPPLHPNQRQKKEKKETDPDNNIAAELKKTRLADRKSGAVYLFQLPPLLPTVVTAPQTSPPSTNPSEPAGHPSKPSTSSAPEEEEAEEEKKSKATTTQPNPNNNNDVTDPKSKPDGPPPNPQEPHALPPPPSLSSSASPSHKAYAQGVLGHMTLPDADTGIVPTATWSNTLRMDLGRATDYGALSEIVLFSGEDGGGVSGGVGVPDTKKETPGERGHGSQGRGAGPRAKVGEEAWAVGGMGGGVCVVPDWGWLFGG